jgi:RNA polymerase sigma factor (sigma-70 family)
MTLVLTADQERTLFLKFNYARFMISRIQSKLDGRLPDMETKQEILAWNATATQYREQIAETNLALVLAMAKRTRMSEIDFGDLVSEGNMALMRSVDKFDCERGFKFSTYACRAILKAFSRHGMKMTRYRQRFPAEFDPAFEKSDHLATTRATHDQECADEVKHIVLNNDADLSDVELAVIEHRFGLGNDAEEPIRKTLTLEQVGQIIGVTKERVRQIQNKALAKIKCTLEEVAPPGSPAVTAN